MEGKLSQEQKEKQKKAGALAQEILKLAKDEILVNLRFLDNALSALKIEVQDELKGMACDGGKIYYDTRFVLGRYQKEPAYLTRIYLHMLLHCVFYHNFAYNKLDGTYWDLAADIAVENIIIELNFHNTRIKQDEIAENKLRVLKEDIGVLTAEKIYKYFKNNPPTQTALEEYRYYFKKDEHLFWSSISKEELTISNEQWKRISERIKADLKSFSKDKNTSESLEKNLAEATRDHYDYSSILKRFMVMGEDIQINDDEFDYVYYTYGLSTYGNMPLVEPLEYKDVNKVREFVIVIDTSASCRGRIVKTFLNKTYSILKSNESFFRKTNIHIIQCDNQVQSDTKITNDEEFERFISYGKLKGFGATDFRPAFDYIEALREQKEFQNLKGVIYFTDGFGVYPERIPKYDTMFAFLDENDTRPPVPSWAIKVVLEEDELEAENVKRDSSAGIKTD
ncbi:MAG: hypothetical protein K2M46_02680 [Lachnospiraceae bacterium]|nr:hypothetical protein [Lachnospiraceae bacterium]